METIAVIEDDQSIGNLLAEALEEEGYRVERAYSGTEAVYLLERCRPDLILLDLLSGATDYVTKPFELRELLARIRVHLREPLSRGEERLRAGEICLDLVSHSASVGGRPVHLTRTEYAVLKLLMRNSGRAVSKSVILDCIAEDTPDCTESSLKQHVSNLRRKLREAGGRECIQAVWGIGFVLEES